MNNKKATQRHGFKTNEFIVYPAHGVGQIVAIEEQEVAGMKLELFVINFVKDKMTLRVPIAKVSSVGMRKLAEGPLVKRALETLKGRARIKRTMYFIADGEVDVVLKDKTVKLGSGDFFGEIAALRRSRRTATVIARTQVSLLVLGTHDLQALMHREPRIAEHIQHAQ